MMVFAAERLQQEILALRSQIDAAAAARAAAEAAAVKAEAQRDAALEEASSLRGELARLAELLSKQQAGDADQRSQFQRFLEVRAENKKLTEQVGELRKALEKARRVSGAGQSSSSSSRRFE